MFMELYREEKREEGYRGSQEDKRGESKGERQIQPVVSSLSVLHRLEHTEIQRVGYRCFRLFHVSVNGAYYTDQLKHHRSSV